MRFLVVGDLHGRIKDLARIDQWCVRNNILWVIQVGDFGICWPGEDCRITRYFEKRNRQGRAGPFWISILGNHDNYNRRDKLIEVQGPGLIQYVPGVVATPRPHFEDIFGGMLFFGGAVSSDAGPGIRNGFNGIEHTSGRVPNKDWWAGEAPSREEFQAFCDVLNEKKPKYVFTHDGPSFCNPMYIGNDINPLSGLPVSYVSQNLGSVCRATDYLPPYWFYGHYHNQKVTKSTDYPGTVFRCSGFHGEGWLVDDTTGEITECSL